MVENGKLRASITVTRLRNKANHCPKWFGNTQTLQDIITMRGWLIPCNSTITLSELANILEKYYGYTYCPSAINFEVDFLRFLEKHQKITNESYAWSFLEAFLSNWHYPFYEKPPEDFYNEAIYLVFGDEGKVNRIFHVEDKAEAWDWARDMSREHRGGSVSVAYISAIWSREKKRAVYNEAVLAWYRNGKQEC